MLNMDDYTEETLRKICCTCLSIDRKLHQLCKLDDGINNLFFLLSSDSEAYKVMFSRDSTLLFICWECSAIMRRQRRFREQVCTAQKQLSKILDRQLLLKSANSLSKLNYFHQNTYNIHFVHNDNIDNFIDCGPDVNDIKCELESNINNESANDSTSEYNTELDEIKISKHSMEIKPLVKKNRKLKKENLNRKGLVKRKVKDDTVDAVKEEGYSKIKMTEEEMVKRVEIKKSEERYVNATSKCESCVEVFKDENELEEHNSRLHVQKPKLVQCDICLVYIKFWWLPEHRDEHYQKYQCRHCELVGYSLIEILTHLRVVHSMKHSLASGILKKLSTRSADASLTQVVERQMSTAAERGDRLCLSVARSALSLALQDLNRTPQSELKRKAMLTNPILAPKKQTDVPMDKESPLGFKCNECNKYFENRYLRYKHILKLHREGHKCPTCGKTFAFKNTLNKHMQVHTEPPPRQPCPECGKMVRADRIRFHVRIHSDRKSVECVSCDKRFVSHDSYEKHLRYSKKHAVRDVHKYKCTMCDKGFRTMRELNDHIDYNHMGKTQYKCPICHKALATRRSVTRHVSRAHHGIKETSGDKILCQTCGKAFRDKKCLREHELIHSGEKPLSCDECGRSFRQSACLYTHKRRVHKMAAKRLRVRYADSAPADTPADEVDTEIYD